VTVTEAIAANDIACEVLTLAREGVIVTPTLECQVAALLINANKRLGAGYTPHSFLADLTKTRRGGRKMEVEA
jgi:2-phospho-L-lactate guanylyltransferase (CobY/MobA/RfbA family)